MTINDDKTTNLYSSESLSARFLISRALVLGVIIAIGSSFQESLQWVLLGLAIGLSYALSLIVTKSIKLSAQLHIMVFFSLSLLRIAFFGYAFVWLTQGDRMRVLLVFAGFLGYSSWIFLERLLSALGVFPVSRKLSA